MQSIIIQCQQLDEEYKNLVQTIDGMLEDLSIVSLEFVNQKLEILDKYSNTLKSSQIDARIHRNSQLRNLIEYIKMHKNSKSQAQSPPAKMAHHRPKYSFNESTFQTLLCNSSKQTRNTEQDHTLKQKSLNNLHALIGKQRANKGGEDMFRFLQKCMNLIGEKKEMFPEYQELQREYKNIIINNRSLQSKINLEVKSSKIKENISQLMASQESFKSYLNSII